MNGETETRLSLRIKLCHHSLSRGMRDATGREQRLATEAMEWLRSKRDEPRAGSTASRSGRGNRNPPSLRAAGARTDVYSLMEMA